MCSALSAQEPRPAGAAQAHEIDFATVERKIAKPPSVTAAARYGLFLFGRDGETRVWAILDRSDPKREVYDVLYLDKNGNGDLTEAGECFHGKAGQYAGAPSSIFEIGEYAPPGGGAAHKDFTITWTPGFGVRFKMLWHGEKVTFGGYGPTNDSYAAFGSSIASAPIFVPGYDRPFAFEVWMPDTLRRGADADVKVFVGNRGDRRGAFSAVDDKFLAVEDSPVATLRYEDRNGAAKVLEWELQQRC
jgi:hypothetical protein